MDGCEVKRKDKMDLTTMSLEDVAKRLGVTKQAVIDVERKALAKAKRIVKARVKKQDILPD
jgi:DNA-directed RNA polymerase sigma subunit (sigma70/sigma32)